MSLVDMPAELLLDIAEDVCWESETGWDSGRLVSLSRTCRYVSSSVASFVGSSVGHHKSWPLFSRLLQRLYPYAHRVRSITVEMRYHICGSECGREQNSCIAPFVAQCQHNLVHLDLYESTNELLYNLASTADSFPRLRFLSIGSYHVILSIGAVIAVTRKSPSLETLCLIGLRSGGQALIPEENAPFRLRYLHLVVGNVDAPSFAWQCSSSGGSLEHLTIQTDFIEDVEDMAWIDTDTAKATLAVLPRLTVRWHTKLCVAHVIGYTTNLTHSTTHINTLPALDDLPPSLTGIHLITEGFRQSMFVPVGRLKHPDQVVTVTVDESSHSEITSHDIAQACERAGLLFRQ